MTRFRPMGQPRFANTMAPIFACVALLIATAVCTQSAHAYPSYDNGSGVGCVQCHTGFQGGNPNVLHARHLTELGPTSCNLCHPSGGGTTPVLTYRSGTGGGFGCAGCHGVDYGELSVTDGQPKATAYGLRLFHVSKGVTSCGTGACHAPGNMGLPNPFPPVLGENVPPPYYAPAYSNLTNPCWSFQEDMTSDADSVGLDNDGDGLVDYPADPDCLSTPPPTTTTTTLPPAACELAPEVGCIDAGKASLLVDEKKPGKEKIKIALKNLVPVVDQSDFGDPVGSYTSYAVCIYDAANSLKGELDVARAGGICSGKPCFSAKGSGYKYLDKQSFSDGVQKMTMAGGDAGKGKVLVGGKNNTAQLPLGIASALQSSNQVTVQFLSNTGECFALTLTDVKSATATVFKAVGP